MMPAEHWVNADFDLSLRRGGAGVLEGELRRQIDELTLQGLFLGGSEQTALVSIELPGSFAGHLRRSGVDVARPVSTPAGEAGSWLEPHGWCAESEELAKRYAEIRDHPPLEVVRRVNGRSFSARIELDHDERSPCEGVFSGIDELAAHLARRTPPGEGWVVKAEHGNAALAQKRLRGARLDGPTIRLLRRWTAGGDPLVLERWLPRRREFCTVFDLTPAGQTGPFLTHEVISTAEGAFIGAVFEDGPAETPVEQLHRGAVVVARELHAAGYFGPVCLDGFTWTDGETSRTRPIGDINARRHASAGARRLWRAWGGRGVLYWRLFARSKLRLPEAEATPEGEEFPFDPDRRRGTLRLTPLADATGRRLRRMAVVFSADTREQVFALERAFRTRWEGRC